MISRRECLGAFGVGLASGRVRVAFLGDSHPHAAAKVKLVRESARLELAGIAGRDLSRAELLRDSSIRAVLVESDTPDHARDAIEALQAGKHVAVEKPPAVNLEDLRKMVRLAVDRHLTLQVGYMWRSHPAMQAAIEAARCGWLGDIYMVRANMNTLLGAEERKQWAAYPGGHMFELSCHLVDAMVRLMGKPVKITPFLRHDGAFEDCLRDNTAAVMEWPRAIGVITGSSLQPNGFAHRSLEICGTLGTALVSPIEPPVLTLELTRPAGPYKGGTQVLRMGPYQRYVKDIDALADLVEGPGMDAQAAQMELDVQDTLLRVSGML
jgi:predicted dehydrogenase